MITNILEKLLFKNQPVSDEERQALLDWFSRAESAASKVNPLTGQITPGGEQSDITAMVQEALKSRQWVNNLGEISNQTGLQIAGEFRTGNGKVPGDGFTGGRFGWPGFTYDGTEYFLAGVENDILQVGMALATGKIIAGGGDIVLDSEGVYIENTAATSGLQFKDSTGSRNTIHIVADGNDDFEFVNIATDGTISFFMKNDSGNTRRLMRMRQHPANSNEFEIDFEDQTEGGGRVAFGDDHYLDYLKNDGTGSATVWFNERGHNIDFVIKGDTDANLFTLDAGLDAIGIGGAAGSTAKLKVYGAFNATGKIYQNGVSIGYPLTAFGGGIGATVFDPTDSTTYYWGSLAAIPTTTAARRRVYIPRAGTITRVDLFANFVAGSNESTSFYLRLNNTTDTTLTTTGDFSTAPLVVNVTGLSVAVAAGDYFEIKMVTPAWGTNPTALALSAQVWVEF